MKTIGTRELLSMAVALGLAATARCARQDVVAFVPIGDGGALSLDSGPPTLEDAGLSSAPDAGTPLGEVCRTPPIILGDHAEPTCGSAIAERTFHFALCTCNALVSTHAISADAFDSRVGPYTMQRGLGGSIGVNGELNTGAPLSTSGSLWIAGGSGLSLNSAEASLDVGLDLAVAGPLSSSARVTVGRDARLAGRVFAPELDVTGKMTVPQDQPIEVAAGVRAASLMRAPVSVAPPCACDQAQLLDIGAIVERHRTDNDNASVGLTESSLEAIHAPTVLELPCGRFFFRHVGASQRLRLSIVGRASIFVAENIQLDAGLEVELGPGAELDLFVAGTFSNAGPLDLGSFRTPTRTRLFIGGTGTLQLSGGGTLAGNLYAPRAELVASAPLEVFGSVFVRRLATSAPLQFHFDVAVLKAGQDCTAPPATTCSSCGDCPNVACIDGACRACRDDSDCCAPLFCSEGRCEPNPL